MGEVTAKPGEVKNTGEPQYHFSLHYISLVPLPSGEMQYCQYGGGGKESGALHPRPRPKGGMATTLQASRALPPTRTLTHLLPESRLTHPGKTTPGLRQKRLFVRQEVRASLMAGELADWHRH